MMPEFEYNEIVRVKDKGELLKVVDPAIVDGKIYVASISKTYYGLMHIEDILRQPDKDGYAQVIDPISGRLLVGCYIGDEIIDVEVETTSTTVKKDIHMLAEAPILKG